jgi:hypothetical protein
VTPNDLPICEPDQIRQDCARKLRGVQVSNHIQAILGCLLVENWITPRLVRWSSRPIAIFSVDVTAGLRSRRSLAFPKPS